MQVVADAGPLLSFARAERLALLKSITGSIVIPTAVYEEIVVKGAGKRGANEVEHADWIERRSVRDQIFADRLPHKLHSGEREAITLAREIGGGLLVDELEVRKEAQRLGVHYFGSLALLKEAKQRGLILAVKPVLDELIAAGTYISKSLYQDVLEQVGEA